MKYEIISTIIAKPAASKATEILEDAGIPLLVERVDLNSAGGPLKGFRVLVPGEFSNSAQRLIETAAVFPWKMH